MSAQSWNGEAGQHEPAIDLSSPLRIKKSEVIVGDYSLAIWRYPIVRGINSTNYYVLDVSNVPAHVSFGGEGLFFEQRTIRSDQFEMGLPKWFGARFVRWLSGARMADESFAREALIVSRAPSNDVVQAVASAALSSFIAVIAWIVVVAFPHEPDEVSVVAQVVAVFAIPTGASLLTRTPQGLFASFDSVWKWMPLVALTLSALLALFLGGFAHQVAGGWFDNHRREYITYGSALLGAPTVLNLVRLRFRRSDSHNLKYLPWRLQNPTMNFVLGSLTVAMFMSVLVWALCGRLLVVTTLIPRGAPLLVCAAVAATIISFAVWGVLRQYAVRRFRSVTRLSEIAVGMVPCTAVLGIWVCFSAPPRVFYEIVLWLTLMGLMIIMATIDSPGCIRAPRLPGKRTTLPDGSRRNGRPSPPGPLTPATTSSRPG